MGPIHKIKTVPILFLCGWVILGVSVRTKPKSLVPACSNAYRYQQRALCKVEQRSKNAVEERPLRTCDVLYALGASGAGIGHVQVHVVTAHVCVGAHPITIHAGGKTRAISSQLHRLHSRVNRTSNPAQHHGQNQYPGSKISPDQKSECRKVIHFHFFIQFFCQQNGWLFLQNLDPYQCPFLSSCSKKLQWIFHWFFLHPCCHDKLLMSVSVTSLSKSVV